VHIFIDVGVALGGALSVPLFRAVSLAHPLFNCFLTRFASEREAKYKNQWQSRATVLRSAQFLVYLSSFFVELHFVFRAWETFFSHFLWLCRLRLCCRSSACVASLDPKK